MAIITNPLLPTNTLESVNIILGYLREPAIDDLALVNTSFAVETAYRHLMQSSRLFQSRGWTFNQYERTYTPLPDGTLTLPSNIVAIRPSDDIQRVYGSAKPILRGSGKIVDACTGLANTWGAPLKFLITELLDFEDLPEAAKTVITLNAASLTGEQVGEGVELTPYHQNALMTAEADLMDYELQAEVVNFYSTLNLAR